MRSFLLLLLAPLARGQLSLGCPLSPEQGVGPFAGSIADLQILRECGPLQVSVTTGRYELDAGACVYDVFESISAAKTVAVSVGDGANVTFTSAATVDGLAAQWRQSGEATVTVYAGDAIAYEGDIIGDVARTPCPVAGPLTFSAQGGSAMISDVALVHGPDCRTSLFGALYASAAPERLAFPCAEPDVTAEVNESHVVVRAVTFSEAGVESGQSEFAYATFQPLLASDFWSNPAAPLSGVFADISDPMLFQGTCDIQEAELRFPTAASVTNAPQIASGQWVALDTPDLVEVTAQSAGCLCAAWLDDGALVPLACDARPPGAFYAASGGWALRQNTCGAAGDNCSSSQPSAFVFSDPSQPSGACSLRTESRLVMPLATFVASGNVLAAGDSTFVWSVYVVENGILGDVPQTRVTVFPAQLALYAVGSVVEALPTGDIAPPLILTIAGQTAGGPAVLRALAGNQWGRLVWLANGYVRQGNATVTLALGQPPEWLIGTNASCQPAAYSCAHPRCAPQPHSSLPGVVISALSPAAQSTWISYNIKITCDVLANPGDRIPAGCATHFFMRCFGRSHVVPPAVGAPPQTP